MRFNILVMMWHEYEIYGLVLMMHHSWDISCRMALNYSHVSKLPFEIILDVCFFFSRSLICWSVKFYLCSSQQTLEATSFEIKLFIVISDLILYVIYRIPADANVVVQVNAGTIRERKILSWILSWSRSSHQASWWMMNNC